MSPLLIADCILIAHAVFVAVVVFSLPLIILGGFRGWRWVRLPAFRFTHLGMIGFVVLESLIGMACPLTVWESRLREGRSQAGYGGRDFIAYWLDRALFYNFPTWVFTLLYVSFGLLVVSLFYFVPVRSKPSS